MAERRSILITGCSSGCGLDAAFTLKARGWRVLAACRKERDCEELRDQGAPSTLLPARCSQHATPSTTRLAPRYA